MNKAEFRVRTEMVMRKHEWQPKKEPLSGQTMVQVLFNEVLVHWEELVAHTGLEPVISALRGQRVNQLHQCAKGEFGL